ncbi:hypothetical protein [Clostridium sp.]|uniref:hypothetical protein n=1 Tax=Clostridium sp. TaxID=1506 RepID=UPI002852C3C9|nr:hypothetical protein [Clostridium sp.]
MDDNQVLSNLDDTDSKYLASDRARHAQWLDDINERNQKMIDDSYIYKKLNPEKAKKEADKITRQQFLIQTDPKYRELYFKNLKARQNAYSQSEAQRLQEEMDHIDKVRDYEYEEEEQARKDADPLNALGDVFSTALSTIPTFGPALSIGSKILTGALQGGKKMKSKISKKKRVTFG